MKKYTYSAKDSDNQDKWWVVDAEGAILGRLASQVAATCVANTTRFSLPMRIWVIRSL